MSETGAQFFQADQRVAVLTAEPVGKPLDYLSPEGGCHEGAFVEVPLGPRKVIGVVWGEGEGGFARDRLRRVSRVLDAPPMRDELREFLVRAADYTLTALPAMLRLATRTPGLGEPPGTRKLYVRGDGAPARMTPARERVLEVLEDYDASPRMLGELAEAAGVSSSVIKGLLKGGAVVEIDTPRDTPFPCLDPDRPGPVLTEDQSRAAQSLRAGARAGYAATLLRGVTGSGKTEVYLEAVAETLRAGRQALVLLPEIALTAEFLDRVEVRFGARPAEWHSGVTQTERRRLWRMVGKGGCQLVVGARSALFLPFQDLGLIVIDEEHDTSYKQEEGVLYNARDMAVLRGATADAQVVLASATPSLESWANAEAGKYRRLDLHDRFGPAVMPEILALDMRAEKLPADRWVSTPLRQAIGARIEAGEQALLFLNRRGFAPVTICRACGHQLGCTHCDARLVEHRFLKRLMCHQCGETAPIPDACPACGAKGRLAAVGPGVERLTEEATALFPEARIATLSSDLFGSARALKDRIAEIASGGADIVIGTQIVAKGHNFPNLTLVGVVDADLGLQGSDMRAAERTFQLMRQVAGRAGRSERPGRALLQTHQPDHPVIRAIIAGDEEGFWRAEAGARAAAGMPPYGRMAGIILSSTELQDVMDLGRMLKQKDVVIRDAGGEVYGPAPAPFARIRGRHRVRLLIKAPKGVALQRAIAAWIAPVKAPSRVRMSIDIDPQSFL
ncbi:MAG: primosomal protein N' [Pseudomonadota bacterium]